MYRIDRVNDKREGAKQRGEWKERRAIKTSGGVKPEVLKERYTLSLIKIKIALEEGKRQRMYKEDNKYWVRTVVPKRYGALHR